jgi:hypothetical protein
VLLKQWNVSYLGEGLGEGLARGGGDGDGSGTGLQQTQPK